MNTCLIHLFLSLLTELRTLEQHRLLQTNRALVESMHANMEWIIGSGAFLRRLRCTLGPFPNEKRRAELASAPAHVHHQLLLAAVPPRRHEEFVLAARGAIARRRGGRAQR